MTGTELWINMYTNENKYCAQLYEELTRFLCWINLIKKVNNEAQKAYSAL